MIDRAWHRANPEAFAQLQDRVTSEYPDLHFHDSAGQLLLSGVYPIVEGGRVVDRYRIEVAIPRGGPDTDIPAVKETAERIPRDPDHHMLHDGVACLFIPEDFWYNHPKGMDLLAFLNGPVRAFFVGQSLVEHDEQWPQGARPHGNEGIVDFYAPFLGTRDLARVKACVDMLAARKLRGHKRCPCGSGKPLRDCHLTTLRQLRSRIPKRCALASLSRLRSPQGAQK